MATNINGIQSIASTEIEMDRGRADIRAGGSIEVLGGLFVANLMSPEELYVL